LGDYFASYINSPILPAGNANYEAAKLDIEVIKGSEIQENPNYEKEVYQ
jgi:hypothetical protein